MGEAWPKEQAARLMAIQIHFPTLPPYVCTPVMHFNGIATIYY